MSWKIKKNEIQYRWGYKINTISKRARQIHYQKGNEKYIYDVTNNQLVDFKTKDVAPN